MDSGGCVRPTLCSTQSGMPNLVIHDRSLSAPGSRRRRDLFSKGYAHRSGVQALLRPGLAGRKYVRSVLCFGLLGFALLSSSSALATTRLDSALDGPWRWLEPDLDGLHFADSLASGPWLESAVSRDPDRREESRAAIERVLESEAPPSEEGILEEEPAVQASILRRAALDSARLLEAAGASAAAAEAYTKVVASGDVVLVDVWHGLAVNYARAGDVKRAERAFLFGLDASGRASDQIRLRYDLAGFYAQQGRLLESIAVVEALMPHAPDSRELNRAQRALGYSIDLAAQMQPKGGFADWPTPELEPGWEVVNPRVATAAESLPEPVRDRLLPFVQSFVGDDGTRSAMMVGAGALVLLAGFVLFRQRGDLAISIEYPEELRGIFRVRVRAGSRPLPDAATEHMLREGGASTRREHHMVSRETQFQRLFTGRYQVIVDGLLIDPATDEVLSQIHEEKIVRVRHKRTVRLEFDEHPTTCPVDLAVMWGERPAQEAQITVPGMIDKPRAAARGSIRVLLPKGDYRLLIGCGDRVFDRELHVSSFRPSSVTLDVLDEKAVFKGCPPAVEPYLVGDLPGVAKALERDGQSELGFRLLASKHEAEGEAGRAADFYESAGDPMQAARLRLAQGDSGRAAALFEQAEAWLYAAEAHKSNGAVERAGECYETALDYERAIECYKEASAIDKWVTALERYGRVFEASKLAIEHNQRPRAIRLLQRVEATDPDFREACGLLADAFETEGHFDLAAAKMNEYIGTFRPAYATAETYSRLAELWENAGHNERALEVLEDLRRREPTFPNIAARIELLRKARSASGHLFSSSGGRMADQGATAFVGDVRYELQEEIGRGGMGVVYRARDSRLDRIVALKRLPEGLRRHHPRALQFFLREAQSAARLNHPNIVTVFDADQQDGQFFITMELLEGQPLHTILHERGQLSPSNVLGIARQACRGLEYAHAQGIVHRDIKTANLFVTTDRVVKIMDFGLAKVLEEVRGATTMVSGTPYYMSPEQVLGQDVDHRSDLYSFGVTLFELSTGVVPFDTGEVAYHHRHTPVPDPQLIRPDLPDDLSQFILRLLSKDAGDRYQSATEMLAILTEMDHE